MLSLCADLYLMISRDLNDQEKIRMSMMAKKLVGLKYIFTYVDKIYFNTIKNLSFFDNFTNVMVSQNSFGMWPNILPIKCKYVHVTLHEYKIPIFKTTLGKYVRITHLKFDDEFNIKICSHGPDDVIYDGIPGSVTHLTFGNSFNHPCYIPANVTHLIFGSSFDEQMYIPISESIKYLKLGDRCNLRPDFSYFKNITHLIFGNDFNQPIDKKLPATITHLTFGNNFNQQIHDIIPEKVTHLTFGDNFNQLIIGAIPNSVTHLTFGRDFDKKMQEYIPKSVTHLTIY